VSEALAHAFSPPLQINLAAGMTLQGAEVSNPNHLKLYHCEPPITIQQQPDGAKAESYMQGAIGVTEAGWDDKAEL
jgi:hypothetical protein